MNSDGRPAQILRAANVAPVLAFLAPLAIWAFSSAGLFTVDEYFYRQMAAALAFEGRFSFAQMRLEGVDAAAMGFAFPVEDGRLMPQYPSGYAFLAAPFALFGAKGMMLLNAIASAATVLITMRLGARLGGDERVAVIAALVLLLASFFTTYVAAVWPHALATLFSVAALFFALGGAERRAGWRLALAGLIIGAGCSIRIDLIVLAPAILLWLRLAGVEESRKQGAFFAGGLGAGLFLCAALNSAKFGVFSPIHYGNQLPQNDPAAFLAAGAAAAIVLAAAYAFDIPKALARASFWRHRRYLALGLALFALLLLPIGRAMLHGAYVFAVDQQASSNPDNLEGIERNAAGFIVFFGVMKKSLLQSAPALIIFLAPVARFIRGEGDRRTGLLLLAAAAYLALYAVNETDAGLALNQRFLTPILPIYAVIAAIEWRRLSGDANFKASLSRLFILLGFFLFLPVIGASLGEWPPGVAIALYLPLFLAAATGVLILAALIRPSRQVAGAALGAFAAALGASAAIAAHDLALSSVIRRMSAVEEAALSRATEKGALVLTDRIILWGERATKDISVMLLEPGLEEEARRAASVFLKGGRPVYLQAAPEWSGRLGPGLETADAASASQTPLARIIAINP